MRVLALGFWCCINLEAIHSLTLFVLEFNPYQPIRNWIKVSSLLLYQDLLLMCMICSQIQPDHLPFDFFFFFCDVSARRIWGWFIWRKRSVTYTWAGTIGHSTCCSLCNTACKGIPFSSQPVMFVVPVLKALIRLRS